MTNRIRFTRRRLGKSVLAGATLLGAPLPLSHAFASYGEKIAQGTPQEIARHQAVLDVYLGEPEAP